MTRLTTIAVLISWYFSGSALGLIIGVVPSLTRLCSPSTQSESASSFTCDREKATPASTRGRGKRGDAAILASTGSGDSTGFGSRARHRTKEKVKIPMSSDPDKQSPEAPPVVVLKRSTRWACVKDCGACCYLAPEDRPDLEEFLSDPNELALYKSMTLENGWCKHFDQENRACTIFEDRPRFCRVETDTFGDMYGIDSGDMDEFCTACCKDQIGLVYGSKSKELRVFKAALAALARGERPIPETNLFDVHSVEGEREQGTPEDATNSQIRDWGIVSVVDGDGS